jgi:hypothetical protein
LYAQIQNCTVANNSNLKISLLAKSPYLSIGVLTSLGNVSESIFSKEWYKEVVKANIEVYEDYEYRIFLMTKTQPFTGGDMAELFDHYTSTKTARFAIRSDIAALTSDIADLDNWLLSDALINQDPLVSAQIPALIEQRNNETKYAELMNFYFGIKDWGQYEAALLNLENQLQAMPLTRLKTELIDLITVQTYHRAQLNSMGHFDLPLTQNQIDEFTTYREELTGKAALYASNILCFWADICEEQTLSDPFGSYSSRKTEALNSDFGNKVANDLKIVPNPNSGSFYLELETGEIESVEILDVHGKRVQFDMHNSTIHTAQISMGNAQNGLYIIQVKHKSGEISTSRLIKK